MSLSWLPLTEYSSKYKVSISTLRRRIKSDDIKYTFSDGKYLILDEPPSGALQEENQHRPSQSVVESPSQTPLKGAQEIRSSGGANGSSSQDEPIITAANRLLTELKQAYTRTLQEKEEYIFSLREEISDLKTLVKVLESENQRLKNR